MDKFCGKCGAKLDEDTGFCPNCDSDKLNKQAEIPEEVEKSKSKQDTASESKKPLSKKEAKKQRKADKKAAKKAKKKEKWASMTFGQKVRKFFTKLIAIVLCLVILLSFILGTLVYFDLVDVPVISTIMDKIGIKDIPEPDTGHIQIGGKFTSINVVDSNSAIAAAQEVAKNSGLENAANELSVASINAVDGVTYYRLQQNYNGIPVYGRTFIISADDSGNTQSLTSNSIDIDDVDTSKTISLEEAKAIIKNYLDTILKSSSGSTIVFNSYLEIIYTFSDVSPVFAYKFNAMVGNELYDLFLGVEEKSVIACFATNMSQTVSGTGIDVNGNNTSFNVNKNSDTSYTLEDFDRNIRVFDASNQTVAIGEDYIYIVDSKGKTYKSNGSNWVDKNNNIVTIEDDNGSLQQGNWKVVDGNGNVLDENAYCLVDIYGKDIKLDPVESNSASFTNSKAVTLMKEAQKIYDFFLEEFSRIGFDANNGSMSLVANNTKGAYSSDIAQSTPTAMLVFGNDNEMTTELIAHEYMHSVERSIRGMMYEGESGAIMEAYSDLFGEILEDYNDGTLNGNCDWIHHAQEELGYDHSRNIENPNESDNPSKVGEETRPFWLRLVIAKDEVHHCSTIISHAAYIMTTTQGSSTSLTMDELMNLWYRTLLTLPSNCTFSDLRESMILTATNIGFPTEKINRVSSAFSMVGIESNNHSGEYSTDIQISVFDNEGKRYSEYSIDISGQKNLPLWFTEDYTVSYGGSVEPVSVHLDKGDYTITVTDKNNTSNSYSKTITVCEDASGKELRFATDFGDKQYSPKKKGEFEPSNILTGAVEFNGHWYKVIQDNSISDWNAASQYCNTQNGYLATITSAEENDFLYSYITQEGYYSAYFGLSDAASEGNWTWNNGEEVSYTNWHRNEPNSENSSEDYALFYYKYSDGTWNDGDFGNRTVNGGTAFICEWGEYMVASGNAPAQEPIRTTSDERDIVLVLDVSGSMSGTPMTETKKAATNFVNTILEEDASIGIVTYEDSAEQLSDFSVDKNHLTRIVTDIYDGGGTNIESGLVEAKSMLDSSNAKKKIIVLMSDGEPNRGKEGEELIAYADEIKNEGVLIYTLGFFENMSGGKSSAQYLMEHLASDGCHCEVANADDLVFFFEDMADQINGQKYIYVRIACPVDVSVTYNGETLSSSEENQILRTDFGTLTFEENEDTASEQEDDRIKVLRLKEGADYDVQIAGIGRGMMDYTIGFMDENGDYSDFRRFKNIKITKQAVIDTVATVSDESVLNIDEDGDGKYDVKLRAKENGYGEEVKQTVWVYVGICGGAVLLIITVLVAIKICKGKKRKVR